MMKYRFKFYPIWVLTGWLFFGCQSSRPFYANNVKDWEILSDIPGNQISRVVYLLGDAGETPEKSAPVINAIKNHITSDQTKNDIVFLGDNIYPDTV